MTATIILKESEEEGGGDGSKGEFQLRKKLLKPGAGPVTVRNFPGLNSVRGFGTGSSFQI